MSETATQEFEAIKTVHGALEPLDEEARSRVLSYITSLLGINTAPLKPGKKKDVKDDQDEEGEENDEKPDTEKGSMTFGTFAELYAATNPSSNGEKALVAGYWLQVCQRQESFTGAAANKELTHLGRAISNITDAIDSVKDQNPSLILQLKKSGSSRQARKLYKVSYEGVKQVEAMISG